MKESAKKRIRTMISALLLTGLLSVAILGSVFHTSGSTRFFSGAAQEYYEDLLEAGFPSDYALSLTELHLLHPTWEFEPLLITQAKPQYTWSYVIRQETEPEDNNLIPSSATYAPYRHPTNNELYDAGHYQASVATVEYFMDPRNFLNETDIFQFFDLSATEGDCKPAVEAVLAGTFMENTLLENGLSYADYFCAVGAEIGIHPVFIATKARQEQGVNGTSPIISGSCGTLLADYYVNQTVLSANGKEIRPPADGHTEESLQQLDGYYNLFNVNASGNGLFTIYYNAMNRAVKGTEHMAEAWGGSPSWDTRWKALYGGAYFLKSSYVDAYQSTVYLQKFNVDSRAEGKNFWKQYSQSVSAAMSEARTLYTSFAAGDALDAPCRFLIPVYGGMPTEPCPDPAGGSCSYTALSTSKYSYEVSLTAPVWTSNKNAPIYRSIEAVYGETLKLSGIFYHSYGVSKLEYRIDDGEWIAVNGSTLNVSLEMDFPQDSEHMLTVRGTAAYDHDVSAKKNNYHFLCAVFYLSAVQPDVTLSLQVGNTVTDQIHRAGTTVSLPPCEDWDFVGWLGSDGSLYPSAAEFLIKRSITYKAVFLPMQVREGAALYVRDPMPHLKFRATVDRRGYDALCALAPNAFTLYGRFDADAAIALTPQSNGDGQELLLELCTAPLAANQYGQAFSPSFFAVIRYTDGTQTTIYAMGETSRTARQVAQAALQDNTAAYSTEVVGFLSMIAGNT